MTEEKKDSRFLGTILLNTVLKKWNKFFYRNPSGSVDPDNQWKLQNEQIHSNEVYSFVNFGTGGIFLDEYSKGKTPEDKKKYLLDYFNEKIVQNFLCNPVETVTRDAYQNWHNKQHREAIKLMEQKEAQRQTTRLATDVESGRRTEIHKKEQEDNLSQITLDSVIEPFETHEIKWRLDKRGAIGETPIHMLFLNASELHIEIAAVLLEAYPELAIDIYEGYEYYGESCLHFAIVQNNFKAVQILLKTKKVNVKARARGKFFIPVDVKRGDIRLKKQQFQGFAYYGELPLAFAASVGNPKIYDLLIEAGCDPTEKDRYGNNVLHLTVIHDKPDMYYHAIHHKKVKAEPYQTNNDDLTPLALAAKLGKQQMFKKILEVSSRRYWSYNTVTCSAYPLKSLDTIGRNGETDWNSALMMIIRGRKEDHLDLVSDSIVHQLLDEKWQKFGKFKFIRILLAFVLHCLFLSVAIYLRPNDQSMLRYGTSDADIARYVFESLVIIVSCLVVYYALREIYLESISGYWYNMTAIPSRLFYLISCILLITCIPMRFLELYSAEEWILVFAVPGVWSYLLFFFRNSSLTGPFITMIFRISATDIARFAVIYAIVVFTSGVAFYYQYEGQNIFAFLTELGTFMTLFQMSFGEFDYEDILNGKYQPISIGLFIVFMVIVHILLLNMLIAMITRTYEKITKQSEKVWRRQWASMVVTMERSHRPEEKLDFQRSYDMNINAKRVTREGVAVSEEQSSLNVDNRALMVVHHQKTSESGRRKEVKNKWKKVGQKVTSNNFANLETPAPTLEIRSLSGFGEFVADAPGVEEDDEDNTLLGRVRSALSRPGSRLNYSDAED